jgi:hypothetical protein
MKSTIMKYDDWLLEGVLLEKLNFASGFVDPAPLRILTKIWENYSALAELGLTYFNGFGMMKSELGRIETSDRKISVYIEEDTRSVAKTSPGKTTAKIVLANDAPASRMKTSVLFHEVLHAINTESEIKPDWSLEPEEYSLQLYKIWRLHLPTKKGLKTPRLNNAAYWYTSNEFSSYIGQLYLAVWELLSDSAKAAKANELLRAGKISEIFQMLPEDYLERKIYQLYFGGGDEVAINDWEKIIENKPKRGQFSDPDDLDMDFVRKGLISFLPASRRDKILKKFRSSLYSVISGEIKILKTEVSIFETLYNLIEIEGLLPKYPNLKKIERLKRDTDSPTRPSYLTSFLTPIEIAITNTITEYDTEKRIKEIPNHAWTRSEILEWIKKYTEAKISLRSPLEYLYDRLCEQSTEKLIERFKGNWKEDHEKNRLEYIKFNNLPVPQKQAIIADYLVKRYQEDLDVIKKIFG